MMWLLVISICLMWVERLGMVVWNFWFVVSGFVMFCVWLGGSVWFMKLGVSVVWVNDGLLLF